MLEDCKQHVCQCEIRLLWPQTKLCSDLCGVTRGSSFGFTRAPNKSSACSPGSPPCAFSGTSLSSSELGLARPSRRFLTAFDQINELTELRAELPFLADVPRNVAAQLLVELDKAWQRCFSRIARAPRFKRKGRDSLGLTEPHPKVWRLQGKTLRFPKLGNLRVVLHRPLEGTPKSCTIRRDGDQWFVSILCQVDRVEPVPRSEPVVALDRGSLISSPTRTASSSKIRSPSRRLSKGWRRRSA